jgi:hypothetical protein
VAGLRLAHKLIEGRIAPLDKLSSFEPAQELKRAAEAILARIEAEEKPVQPVKKQRRKGVAK